MMRRIAGAAFFGLGLVCLVLAAALVWLIVPMERKVPLNLQPPDVVLVAPQATFVQAKLRSDGNPQVSVQHADLRSMTRIQPDFAAAANLTGKLAERTLIWNVYQATDRADTGEPINRAESRIALDRVSGAAVPWDGQCYNDVKVAGSDSTGCKPGNIAFAGQLYLFPFNVGRKTYEYWDSGLETVLPIDYRGEENHNGLPTYRFEQVVPQRTVAMDEATLTGLLGFLAPGAHSGSVSYQASRTLWVEPETGAIVGYREQQHRELVPDTGASVPMLDATFEYDQKTLTAVHDQAQHGRFLLLLLGRYVPIGLAVVGLALLALGVLVTRRAAVGTVAVAEDVPEPEPTPVPRA